MLNSLFVQRNLTLFTLIPWTNRSWIGRIYKNKREVANGEGKSKVLVNENKESNSWMKAKPNLSLPCCVSGTLTHSYSSLRLLQQWSCLCWCLIYEFRWDHTPCLGVHLGSWTLGSDTCTHLSFGICVSHIFHYLGINLLLHGLCA